MKCDVLIVGAGFAGLVMAERLSNELGKTCLVVDRRDHIGGNAYDYYNDAGVLVHKYGPHLFHTNSSRILEYLSKFTEWIPAQYKVKSFTGGKLYSFPLNLETFEQWVGDWRTTEDMEEFLASVRVPIEHPKNSEEVIISQVGWKLYEMFYKGYTLKQWGRHPRDLDASVCARIPIRTDRNELYFNDTYQCMPKDGYTAMFRRMLNNPRIQFLVNTDHRDINVCREWTVYTGPIDEYFGYAEGKLPYRSLSFVHETFSQGFYQPAVVVNYPNSENFTRIVEIKHVTGQKCSNTTIVKEYPESEGEPYYPIPAPDAAAAYGRYKGLIDMTRRVSFVGRLATYKYLNMDQVVGQALSEFEKLRRIL